MEPPNEPTQAASSLEVPWLPTECNFTMQQWLYRRTLHTKRYKKRYVVLHNERLYTFTKLSSFEKFDSQNIASMLKSASNSWILTGSVVSADPDVNSGLFKWKIEFKGYKKPVTASDNFNKFLMNKPEINVTNVDHIDSIFEDVTSSVLENSSTMETHDCLWFATTNHKIASVSFRRKFLFQDWLIALLYTSRYGSLYNLIYKNPMRRRYQQFTLPWYLMPLDYLPNLSNDENSKPPLASFTYIKIDIIRVFDFPMLPNAKIYVAVEFNSSFYILQLYRFELENSTATPLATLNDDDSVARLTHHVNRNVDFGLRKMPSDETSLASNGVKSVTEEEEPNFNPYPQKASIHSAEEDLKGSVNYNLLATSTGSITNSLVAAEDDPQNVLTRLLNLNSSKNVQKKQFVEKRTIVYDGASIYIPVYKNTTQEIVWLHFFGDYDVYMGTASIRDVDFASRDPAPVKTCMIKLIDTLNPLNYKRVDVSTYKGESTVLNRSGARSVSNDRGFVELTVIIPKHLGNFLDPVTISHGSPKEYLSNATKSSISVGIQMLIANIKRVRQSFTVLKDIIHVLKSVLEFRNGLTSFAAMFYFIFVFGIFPNRMLIIFLLPILLYIVCTHPSFGDLTFLFLLRFPILIAILPKRLIYPFLLMPKLSCILCSKKPSFLKNNAQIVDPDMITKEEIASRTFQYSSSKKMLSTKSMYINHPDSENDAEAIINPFSAANAIQVNRDPSEGVEKSHNSLDKSSGFVDFEKRISVHLNSLPMITSKHLLNDCIEVTRFRGTRIETCKHRGIIVSYLSVMLINEFGPELFESIKGDGLSIIKGYHDIYYNIPPYRHVPFWPNVKFTLYFFCYMFFLTFFGGFSNFQILHLLHRNKLMCRLTLESKGVVDLKQKLSSRSKLKSASLYENERRILFGKFSKMNLRFYERGYFSTEDGQFVSVDLSNYLVRLVVNENTDNEGWTYARNWNSTFTKEPNSMTFVRRRKWILTPKDGKHTEYILKRKFSSNLTCDHFTNFHTINKVNSVDHIDQLKFGNDMEKIDENVRNRENECVSISSGDSWDTSKLSSSHVNAVSASDSKSERNELLADEKAGKYPKKGRVKRLVERIKEVRERRRNQREDTSNMQKYLSSLVSKRGLDLKVEERKFGLLKGFKRRIQSSKAENDPQTQGLYHFSHDDEVNPFQPYQTQGGSDRDIITSLINLSRADGSSVRESPVPSLSNSVASLKQKPSSLSGLNSSASIDHSYPKAKSVKFFTVRKMAREKRPLAEDLAPEPATEGPAYTTRISRLFNYLSTLHSKDRPSTDRSGFSTISQLSTLSQNSTLSHVLTGSKTSSGFPFPRLSSQPGLAEKSALRKLLETLLAVLLGLPICVALDLAKLCLGFFCGCVRSLFGLPEPESGEPRVGRGRVLKYRAFARLVISSEGAVSFKLVRPRRCFMLGDRLRVFRRICRAENLYFVHNLNKLMFDSSRDYGSDSDSDSDSDSSTLSIRQSLDRSFSSHYHLDTDSLLESDAESLKDGQLSSEDDLDELRTLSMNPFDLDESDEEILNMMRRSYDSTDSFEASVKRAKKRKGKIANYLSGIYYKRLARKGKYIDEQHLSDYEPDSNENTESGNKIGVIGMLKKVKDQIVMANYKINLYNMRFEKFLNMFSWKNYSVTTIVLFLLILVIMLNLLFNIEIIMLAYILYQFKAGYRRGTWERIIISTTTRHINKAIVELEIFRPFWDLSTHQIQVLSNRIKSFSSIELEINTIREAKDELHLAYIVSDKLISTKFSRNWKRYRWINNLFRQAPCKQY